MDLYVGAKIAGFSLMGTIIDAKTHTKKELLSDGWTFKYPSVPAKLAELYADQYNIVIFTNLAGTHEELNLLIAKLDKIIKTIGIPISYYILNHTPSATILHNGCNNGSVRSGDTIFADVDKEKSFYCGNNAGRPESWKYKQIGSKHIQINRLADKSKNDLYFAFNSKVRFILPEAIFCKLDIDSINKDIFEIIPRPYLDFNESIDKANGMEAIIKSIDKMITSPLMILMIGLPASGKTELTNYIISRYSETHDGIIDSISKDEISNKRLYNLKLESLINKGKHIIVDNTNVKHTDRLFHINAAKKHGYKIMGITIDTHPNLINHLNVFRAYTGKKSLIPKVVYYTMMKHLKTDRIDSTEFDILLSYVNQINPAKCSQIYDLYC
jgi:bifunctional polynucleotide phosphatase/kinase